MDKHRRDLCPNCGHAASVHGPSGCTHASAVVAANACRECTCGYWWAEVLLHLASELRPPPRPKRSRPRRDRSGKSDGSD
jgi:hypothetical protein